MDYPNPLQHFARPKARIDFLTIRLPSGLMQLRAAEAMQQAIRGRIECPKRWRQPLRDDWITIHDPTTSDLQWLLDHHPETQVLTLEVAVDFELLDRSDDPGRLTALHGWLKTRLFPQRHESMARVGKRKFYDARNGQIRLDNLRTKSGNESVYWTNPKGYEQVRLYIKVRDDGKPITDRPHSVRIEPTLFGGGCQTAGLYRVAELPEFADQLRCYLSRLLYVAEGIKPRLKRTDRIRTARKVAVVERSNEKERASVKRNWDRYGAAWAARHGYTTIPDAATNRLIGGALKGLRDELTTLKLTKKVAGHPEYEVLQTRVVEQNCTSGSKASIEGGSTS